MSEGATLFSTFLEQVRARSLPTNHDRCALVDQVEQLDDIVVAHADTAMTIRRTDFVLVFRAMNIDETVVGVGVAFSEAIEPKNTRRDEVVSGGKRVARLQRNPRLENGAGGRVLSDLF